MGTCDEGAERMTGSQPGSLPVDFAVAKHNRQPLTLIASPDDVNPVGIGVAIAIAGEHILSHAPMSESSLCLFASGAMESRNCWYCGRF
jgi:hypothetical protein